LLVLLALLVKAAELRRTWVPSLATPREQSPVLGPLRRTQMNRWKLSVIEIYAPERLLLKASLLSAPCFLVLKGELVLYNLLRFHLRLTLIFVACLEPSGPTLRRGWAII
jgi:hypothetical protein